MRRSIGALVLVMAVLWAAGCARTVQHADVADRKGTTGVFTEVAGGPTDAGKVDLVIRLSVKTHLPGHHVLESGKSLRGKPGYPFVITIDGQRAAWREDGEIERTPEYDATGVRTPEGGDGRRYALEKRLRLAPGAHRIEINLPEETYTSRIDVKLLKRDEPYVLELKPVYQRSGKQRPSFLHGLSRLESYLNGKALQ